LLRVKGEYGCAFAQSLAYVAQQLPDVNLIAPLRYDGIDGSPRYIQKSLPVHLYCGFDHVISSPLYTPVSRYVPSPTYGGHEFKIPPDMYDPVGKYPLMIPARAEIPM
jgi:hypothetical protein